MLVVIASKNEEKLVKELGYAGKPLVITGVGGVNVIRALKNVARDEEIVNIGYVGSNSIAIGTKVIVGKAALLHEGIEYKEEFGRTVDFKKSKTVCYTSTDFVTKTKIKEPCVFDMELAYICALFDKVKAIKYVSDNLNLHEYEKNSADD